MQIYVEQKSDFLQARPNHSGMKKYIERLFIKYFLHYVFPVGLFKMFNAFIHCFEVLIKHFPKVFLTLHCIR